MLKMWPPIGPSDQRRNAIVGRRRDQIAFLDAFWTGGILKRLANRAALEFKYKSFNEKTNKSVVGH